MTVAANEIIKNQYDVKTSISSYPINFSFIENLHLSVIYTDANNVDFLLTQGIHYGFNNGSDGRAVSVYLFNPYSTYNVGSLTIYRSVTKNDLSQKVDLDNAGTVSLKSIELSIADKQTQMIGELYEALGRSFKTSITQKPITIPSPLPNSVLSVDSSGIPFWNPTASSTSTTAPFPVRLVHKSGSPGSASAQCTYTYDVRDWNTNVIILSDHNPVIGGSDTTPNAGGIGTLAAASSGATSIVVSNTGLNNTKILSSGNKVYIASSPNNLYQVVSDVTTNGSGVATVNITPALVNAVNLNDLLVHADSSIYRRPPIGSLVPANFGLAIRTGSLATDILIIWTNEMPNGGVCNVGS